MLLVSDLAVGVGGFQLKLCDGLPHSLLDPHARDEEQRQGVVHGLDGDVERLSNLEITMREQSQPSDRQEQPQCFIIIIIIYICYSYHHY